MVVILGSTNGVVLPGTTLLVLPSTSWCYLIQFVGENILVQGTT